MKLLNTKILLLLAALVIGLAAGVANADNLIVAEGKSKIKIVRFASDRRM